MTNIWRGSQSASSRYWYDLAGNLSTSIVKNVTNCYYYNVQNKLVKIVGTNFVHEFKYNSRSERIAVGTSVNGATMTWRYDACQGPVTLAEFDASTAMTHWYVRGLGVAQGIRDVVAEVDVTGTPKAHYYLCDHRGDTLVVLNPDGAANSTFRYDAFGNMYDVSTNSVYFPRYTFSTKEYLSQPKLYLYAYRVYDPQAGRWTQRDPIDYQDSLNLYQFCLNNPINLLDRDGQVVVAPLVAALAIGGAVVVAGACRYGWMRYWVDKPINQGGVWAYTYVPGLPFAITGKNYSALSDVGKHIIDEHEKVHQDGHWETAAHKRSYDLADEILARGEWNGNPLTQKQATDLNQLRDASRGQLEKRMGGKEELEQWDKERQEKNPDVYSNRKYA
jgi:RHS repeat-associated protein